MISKVSLRFLLIGTAIFLILTVPGCQHRPAISPRITSPVDEPPYVFGQPIAFSVQDDANVCEEINPYDVAWHFQFCQRGQNCQGEDSWQDVDPYYFSDNRLLGNDRLLLLPGDYEVKAEICCGEPLTCAVSPAIGFGVEYDSPLVGEIHPNFDRECLYDWADPYNDNHVTTAHFNMFWNLEYLFSVGLEHQADLALGVLSDDLRQDFQDEAQISLSEGATVIAEPVEERCTTAEADGDQWRVEDQNTSYIVRRKENEPDDTLNIYIPATTPDDPALDEMLGFLECAWATLDYYMVSPLEDASIYRHYGAYEPLTHITVLAGWPDGGGHSQPQGLGYGSGIAGDKWVPAHELFHVFDYAGNPLHNKRGFDGHHSLEGGRTEPYRQQNNAYIFFHESTTGVEQTMASDTFTVWGYHTDDWPYWTPLDLGLLELDYMARPFWAYLINNYGFEPRLTWEGPPTIDACIQTGFLFSVQWSTFEGDLDPLPVGGSPSPLPAGLQHNFEQHHRISLSDGATIIRTQENGWQITDGDITYIIQKSDGVLSIYQSHLPQNFKLFEEWNAQVRQRVREEMGPGAALADYGSEDWCPEWHRSPDPDHMVLYNGEINPPCLQTLEYEMAVLEEMTAVRFPVAGTPLEESLLLDFAVKSAEEFPPISLLSGMPALVPCTNLAGITFARGFEEVHDPELDPDDDCAKYGKTPVLSYSPICTEAEANEHDFYARIKFNIKEDRAKFLRIQANDDATVYVDGKAVIGDTDPEDQDLDNPDNSFPNASTTYADQTYQGWYTHAPVSSIFPVVDLKARTFEIEWVNRGDGLGNSDNVCDPDERSRYLLKLEWYNELSHTFGPIGPDQVEVLSAEFWPGQGSGNPGFSLPPIYDGAYDPLVKEIQLRPVSEGERPFLLPSLGVQYHPVQCPAGYTGDLDVTVRDDRLTHTQPSVHLMVIKHPDTVQWVPGVVGELGDEYAVSLHCDGSGGPASYGGDPAFLLVTARRTLHCDPVNASCVPPEYACDPDNPELCDPPVDPYGTMGAIHYTVLVAKAVPV